MSKQRAFFMSSWEEYQKSLPEKPQRKTRSSNSRKSSPKVYDCSTCKLCESCRSPKIERFGKGRKKILVVGLCPGWEEDKQGIPFVGPSGDMLKRYFGYAGIDLDKDCWRTNIVQCYPGKDKRGKDKNPTKDQIKSCASRLESDIAETKPEFIICLGAPAINAILKPQHLSNFTAYQMHGKAIPCHRYNCWVGCLFHPAFFLHRKREPDRYPDDEVVFGYDLANILSHFGELLPKPLTTDGNLCLTNVSDVIENLEYFSNSKRLTSYDYETKGLTPWETEVEVKSISITDDIESAIFIPLKLKKGGKEIFTDEEQKTIIERWKKFLVSDTPKVIQNVNMEEIWNRVYFNQSMNNYVHDTMIAAHVINNTAGTTSLGFQAYEMTGHEYKKMIDVKNIELASLEDTCNYNGWDARYTLMSAYRQRKILAETGRLEEFYQFLHEGSKSLVNLRKHGIKIDTVFLDELEKDYQEEKELQVLEMRSLPGVVQYEKEHGSVFNPDSPVQLEKILYDIYKEEKYRRTVTLKGSTDEEALNTIIKKTKNEEVKTLINSLFRFRKCCSLTERVANYRGLIDTDGYVHPSYNLNIAETYRSTANDPNIQNVFKHDDELRIFRKCIIPAEERKFPVVPIFEIHDSITFDVAVDKIREAIEEISTVLCTKWFDWQRDVPMGIEFEVGWNWYEVYPLEIVGSEIWVKVEKNKKVKLEEFVFDGYGRTRILLEVDYSGTELAGIAMLSGDPKLTRQIREGIDIHRRWAARIYQKPEDQIDKATERYKAKNGFDFPSIYGSTAENVARTFSEISKDHIIRTQQQFWEEYRYVKEWQSKVMRDYLENGYVEAPNGWRRIGPLSVNQLHNNTNQGISFHILLRSLIGLDEVLPVKFSS